MWWRLWYWMGFWLVCLELNWWWMVWVCWWWSIWFVYKGLLVFGSGVYCSVVWRFLWLLIVWDDGMELWRRVWWVLGWEMCLCCIRGFRDWLLWCCLLCCRYWCCWCVCWWCWLWLFIDLCCLRWWFSLRSLLCVVLVSCWVVLLRLDRWYRWWLWLMVFFIVI